MANDRDEDICPLQITEPIAAASQSSNSATRVASAESTQATAEEADEVSTLSYE